MPNWFQTTTLRNRPLLKLYILIKERRLRKWSIWLLAALILKESSTLRTCVSGNLEMIELMLQARCALGTSLLLL